MHEGRTELSHARLSVMTEVLFYLPDNRPEEPDRTGDEATDRPQDAPEAHRPHLDDIDSDPLHYQDRYDTSASRRTSR